MHLCAGLAMTPAPNREYWDSPGAKTVRIGPYTATHFGLWIVQIGLNGARLCAPLAARVGTMAAETPAAPARTNSRLAARLLAEMRMAALVRTTDSVRKLSGTRFVFDRGPFFLAILRASGGTIGRWPQPTSGNEDGGISINALSHSMRRPFETVRRHVNALIAAGLCVRSSGGVVVPSELRDDPDIAALLVQLHDLLVWGIIGFKGAGVPLPRTASGAEYRPDITLAASIDFALATFENVGGPFDSWLELAVVGAVMTGSARPVTFDPELAALYSEGDTVPPLSVRVAISAAQVSRALGIPYSTVRRQVLESIGTGLLVEHDGAVVVSDQFLGGQMAMETSITIASRAAALLGRLVAGGFPFDDPDQAYIGGPPSLVAFD